MAALLRTLAALLLLLGSGVLGGEECGKPAIPPMVPGDRQGIINGEEAVPHSFPWQVSISGDPSVEPEHYCGASILSPSWVLTAAHCAEIVFIGGATGINDVVILGQHDRRGGAEDHDAQAIAIAAKFIHPEYNTPAKAQDVALLRLAQPANLGSTASPACLPEQGDFGDSSSFPVGASCLLSGWGRLGPGDSAEADMFGQPWRLRRALLPLVGDLECKEIYQEGAGFTIQPTMQCAGGDGRAACNGDSGGPLVCLGEDGLWYQAGIVSFGPSPCDPAIPSVFTRVAGFSQWIQDTVQQHGGW